METHPFDAGKVKSNIKPISGTFGYLTIIEMTGQRKFGAVIYRCRCICGKESMVASTFLRHGRIKSCGCVTKTKTHGMSRTLEYRSWRGMKRRCNKKATPRERKNYYDRGITVCEEWTGKGGFEKFISHVGKSPSPNHSLDRINNDKGYEQGNVRWATKSEQAKNRRKKLSLQNYTTDEILKELKRRGCFNAYKN